MTSMRRRCAGPCPAVENRDPGCRSVARDVRVLLRPHQQSDRRGNLSPECLAQPVAMGDVEGLQLLEMPQQVCGIRNVDAGSSEHFNQLQLDGHMPLAGGNMAKADANP